jgi:imidazolonepropionase-like amidohydrolase
MSRNPFLGLVLVILSTATMLWAQTPQVAAIRAGHLFDSKSGQMLNNQVVLIEGEKISEVGATDRVEIPSGAQVIDLSRATVLPGLVDGHTHVFSSLPAAARVTKSTEV